MLKRTIKKMDSQSNPVKVSKGKKVESTEVILREGIKELTTIPVLGKIKNEVEFEKARATYQLVREIEARWDAKKKAILDPIAQSIKEIKALFAPNGETLQTILIEYQKGLTVYANEAEVARKQSLLALNADKRIKNVETLQAKREAIGDKLAGTMKLRKVVIDNPAKVPKQFWVINETLLKEALLKGEKVPGAHIEEVLTITARK